MQLTEAKRLNAIEWKAIKLLPENPSIHQKDEAITKICQTLSLVKSELIRETYTKMVSQLYKEKLKFFKDRVDDNLKRRADKAEEKEEIEETNFRFPSYFEKSNVDDMMKTGFTQIFEEGSVLKTGIYNLTKDGAVCISNCTIKPLFHVVSGDINQNKKLFSFQNAFERAEIDVEAAATLSVERFNAIINAKYNFMFHGNSFQLKKIMEHLGYGVQRCAEVRILGWQPEGFFAYPDKFISDGKLINLDEYGIGEHNSNLYFSPSQSIFYRAQRADDNVYETLKYLNYHESPINFEKWSQLFYSAYGMNAMYGIGFIFMACFRDLVLRIDGVCPHFYVWGAPGSGKSKMMESMSSFFFSEKRVFAANSGTDFGLSTFLEVYRNTFHFINELDDQDIKPQWLQWFKGAYDNEGRQRGKGGSKRQTETMNVNSALGFAGQKIVNADDNALPMRCIIRNFKAFEEGVEIPKEQMKAYNELKEMESNGGFNSLLVDVMAMREDFKQKYHDVFNSLFVEVQKEIKQRGLRWQERIGRNYCYLLAAVKVANEHFILPFSYKELYEDVIQQINDITKLITGTDATSEFWRIVMNLLDQQKVVSGWHYKLRMNVGNLKLDNKEVYLQRETKLLFIRINEVHTLYKLAYRSETGKEGMNVSSLKSYFENRPYYLGTLNSTRFTGTPPNGHTELTKITSCYVFNYDLMEQAGIQLEYELATAQGPKAAVLESDDQEPMLEDAPF